MRLRKSDIKAARSTKHLDPWLLRPQKVSALTMVARYKKLLEEMGITLHYKRRPKGWKYGRFLMTIGKRVYLGTRKSWNAKSIEDQAALLAHEYGHAQQQLGRVARWLWKYITSARFRFTQEAQCYRQSVRAYRRMGYPKASLRDYAHAKARSYPTSYVSRRLRKDIAKHMPGILLEDM